MGLAKTFGFKTKFSNFLLWTGLNTTIIALIVQFITVLVGFTKIPTNNIPNPNALWMPPDQAWVGLWASLSNFTIQTNILVLCFFFFVLTNLFYENRCLFVYGRFMLAITTYITITMTVFFAVLFKPMWDNLKTDDSISVINFVNTFLLHLVTPIVMILYYLLNSGKYHWKYKKQIYLWTPIISLYLFIYLGYILAKGNFVGLLTKDKTKIDYSFPYPFLNFHNDLTTFFIYIAAIWGLYLVLIFLFSIYNNLIYKRTKN